MPARPSPVKLIGFRPHFKPMRLGIARPHPYSRPEIGQLVSVSPNVSVNVNTGIEKYLFPAGLMAGGASMFILGTAIPMDFRWLTTLAGLGLMGSGVYVLVQRGMQATSGGAGAAPASAAPPTATPIGPGTPAPAAFQPAAPDVFDQLEIQVVSPAPDATVSASGGFLFFGTKKIPVQMRLYNPSTQDASFNLDFGWDEYAAFGGYNLDSYHGTQNYQISLGAGEEKNQEFDLPVQTSGEWTQMQVALAVNKRRTPNENDQLVSNITFTVTS